jgi:predicted RNase H-related nuclease YkuK (DUF458 family)
MNNKELEELSMKFADEFDTKLKAFMSKELDTVVTANGNDPKVFLNLTKMITFVFADMMIGTMGVVAGMSEDDKEVLEKLQKYVEEKIEFIKENKDKLENEVIGALTKSEITLH